MSIRAGVDRVTAVIKMIRGDKLEYQEKAAEDGAIYSRFDQSIRVEA